MMDSVRHNFRDPAPAFTLMELMVSVAILVLIILSVGIIFQSTTRAVGVSQASSELLSNVAAVQEQIERDLSGLDRNAFLVIRCAQFTDASGAVRRCDQMSFLANGSFPNRTGIASSPPLTDNSVAPEAFVWWGQLAIEGPSGATGSPTIPGILFSNVSTNRVPLNQVPTGASEPDFILGRHTTLLIPKSTTTTNALVNGGSTVPSYQNTVALPAIDYSIGTIASFGGSLEAASDVTQSRFAVACVTESQLLGYLQRAVTFPRSAATTRYEADHYCYRYGALRSPYDFDQGTFYSGYFRMHPIALQGVPSFAIDWSDGSVYAASDVDVATGNALVATSSLIGTERWYGSFNATTGLAKGGTYSVGFADHGSTGVIAATPNGDNYAAVFSTDSARSDWPKALRFRYHVADATGRLPGGRDFVQVVKLQ